MPITTTIENRIAEIVFDVPPVNAFDSETWMSLPGIIAAAAGNPDVNCVLIRAAEGARGFCGGVDIKEMQARTAAELGVHGVKSKGSHWSNAARSPEAVTRPEASASSHDSCPVATSSQVTGSVSTTDGGVPRR